MIDETATPSKEIQLIQPMPSMVISENPQRATGRLIRRTIFDLNDEELKRLKLMAQMYAASSFNSGNKPLPESDFFLIMLKGMELGIAPMAAVDTINIIAGKPVLDAKGQLGLVKSSGLLEDIQIDSTLERCIVTIKRIGNSEQIVSFTMEDAKRYKTTAWVDRVKQEIPLSEKDNWKSQPNVMLKWRAVTAALREVFPDIVLGLYTHEELDTDNTIVHEDGSMQFSPPVESKQLSSGNGDVPKTTSTSSKKKQEEAKTEKAWYEIPENIASACKFAAGKGWLELSDSPDTDKLELLKLANVKEFSEFESGKAMLEHIAEEVAKLSGSAKTNEPATTPKTPEKKMSLAETDREALIYWATTTFAMKEEHLMEKVDFSKFESEVFARKAIIAQARSEGWNVVSEMVNHKVSGKSSFLAFHTPLGEMRFYSRQKFRELIGDQYCDENGIDNLPDNEPNEIEPVLLTWEAKGKDDAQYYIVKDALPFMEPEPTF